MHLVYLALDKRAIPSTLPPELQKPSSSGGGDNGFIANFPKDIPPPVQQSNPPPSLPRNSISSVPSIDLLGSPISNAPSFLASVPVAPDWVVTADELARFNKIFTACDADKDGLVSGLEVRDIFIKSGLQQSYLAQIWALCDTNQSGKLTSEQFALAMWMVERKKVGIEPPGALAPNMVPPSLRGPGAAASLLCDQPLIAAPEPKPTFANPELEMISKEIDELIKERKLLEREVEQRESDIRVKTSEVRNLQSELDTLVATLKQLEHQKGEAQKRLDDLKAQVC